MQSEEFRNLLTLKLDWQGAKPGRTAQVGMMYVQKGVRWIPGYKIALDDKGNAAIRLQATLLNEMTDLQDVTVNLVIGVPTSSSKTYRILLRSSRHLRSYLPTSSRVRRWAMRFQQLDGSERAAERAGRRAIGDAGAAAGPEFAGTDRNEDLFVYTVKHVSLKKGQRTVIPVAEIAVKYKDIYTLDLPFAPPREI